MVILIGTWWSKLQKIVIFTSDDKGLIMVNTNEKFNWFSVN